MAVGSAWGNLRRPPAPRPRVPRPDPHPSAPRPDAAPPRPPGPQSTLVGVKPPTFGAAPPPPPPPLPPAVAAPPAAAAPPAVTTPPLTAAAPPPPNYAAMIDADPAYIEAASALAARLNAANITYGWVPDPTAPNGYRLATGADYAGSRAQGLRLGAEQASRDVQNRLNARGFLLSGAQVQGQRNVQQAHAQQLAQAFAEYLGEVAGVEQDRATIRGGIAERLMAQEAPEPPTPPAAASPQEQIDRRNNNNAALDALFRTTGTAGLAKLWHEWKGKVDEHVLRQIDDKLKAARSAKGKK
jgi:hypothetical protein